MAESAWAVIPVDTAMAAYPGRKLADIATKLSFECESTKVDAGGYGGIVMVKPKPGAVEEVFALAEQAVANYKKSQPK